MALRRAGDSAFALAAPPFGPPSFPSATAAGFFAGPVGSAGALPVAISTIILASWLGSRGILDRLSMTRTCHDFIAASNFRGFKLTHYLNFTSTRLVINSRIEGSTFPNFLVMSLLPMGRFYRVEPLFGTTVGASASSEIAATGLEPVTRGL
jgi:hypothetical protein